MRQVKVLLVGFLVAVALAATLHAQNYIWTVINGVPYSPTASIGGTLTMGNGGSIQTGTTAGDTFTLGAYDTDTGPAYQTMLTLTAGTTPTLLFPKGSVSNPSVAVGATNAGVYYAPANPVLAISNNGWGQLRVGDGRWIALEDGSTLGWSTVAGGAGDIALARDSSGLLKVTNASTGQGKLMFSVNIEAVTTTKSPGVQEASEVYTNEGDADGATITLPTAAAGLTYTACIQAAQTLTITAAAGDTIRLASGVTAAAGSISSNVIGSCVTLVALNATEWYGTSIVGSWSY